MNKARYINENVIEVYADNITPKENEEIYKGRLYCENSNCSAEIVYNERQKGRFIRYFSTKKGSKHIEGCKNEIDHIGYKNRISISGESVNVSDEHVVQALQDAYKLFLKQLYPVDSEVKKERKSKKPVSETNKSEDDKGKISVGTASANGTRDVIEGEKEPYIYKHEVSELAENKKRPFREVHGLVKEMKIEKDEAYITVVGRDGSECNLYFGNPFKINHEQEFGLLHYIKKHIDKMKEEGKEIVITCFGEFLLKREKVIIQIYDYKHFRLNNIPFYPIINLYNK
jgi:hypothetical protein